MPAVSKAQLGFFGAELVRREKGKRHRLKGMTTEQLREFLKKSKGKHLPKRVKLGVRKK